MTLTHPESNEENDERVGEDTVRTSSITSLQAGQTVGGRYEVISRLGKGGMGLVYRVKQVFVNKEFALKTIDRNYVSEVAIRRFQQEARAAFSLDHPSIVAVNDFGVLDDQTPFLVMELINGETLGERLKRLGALSLEQAIPIFVQVCFGLAYAHECGIVHRDVKPNNIMLVRGLPLGAEGSIKILDFGIAKFAGHEGGEIQALTRTGEIFGSPLYMSPEQCNGFKVDYRADIYSLGCVLFESLTGTPPFMGENALSTMIKHQGEQAPTLKEATLGGDFPQAVEDIVATMLAKAPGSRYQSLGKVAIDLEAARRGDFVSAASGAKITAKNTTISISRNKFYSLMFALVVLSLVAGYGLHSNQNRAASRPSQAASQDNPSDISISSSTPENVDQSVMTEEDLKEQLVQRGKDDQFKLTFENISNNKSFELIANTPWIHSLVLTKCIINNANLDKLSKLNLRKICLDSSNFNDRGAAQLSLCQIGNIDASGTLVQDGGLAKLSTIKCLHTLTLTDTKITDAGLGELANAKNLGYLDIKRSHQITNRGLLALEHTHLEKLVLENDPVDDAGMAYLARMDSLKSVNLSGTKVTIKGVEDLCRASKTCKEISLKNCENIGQTEISKLRSKFPGVRFLDGTNEAKEPTE